LWSLLFVWVRAAGTHERRQRVCSGDTVARALLHSHALGGAQLVLCRLCAVFSCAPKQWRETPGQLGAAEEHEKKSAAAPSLKRPHTLSNSTRALLNRPLQVSKGEHFKRPLECRQHCTQLRVHRTQLRVHCAKLRKNGEMQKSGRETTFRLHPLDTMHSG